MKVLCFGDSNTYGYDPRSYIADRYDARHRWPELVAARTGWEVINGGLCGREIPRTNQWLPSFSEYDCVLLMLGTNDLLQGASAREAAGKMEACLQWMLPHCKRFILIAPPPLERGVWVPDDGLIAESLALPEAFKQLAQALQIPFIDTRPWKIPLAYDGVHFTEDGHLQFADQIIQKLTDIGVKHHE